MEQDAQVFLVGAGPGDPGLLTLRGKELIERADVLVYDRLVSPQLVRYAKAECELIYVGKTPNNHTLSQQKINELLVEKAAFDKVVVRLKGGDPFVFGRGGEEAEVLRAHGIRYAVVPGVTSCIAAPAYAGIPVTHRNVASSFTVITGHEHSDKFASSIEWEHISKLQGTLVFLMGMKNLPLIVENLLAFGMDPCMPVAVVERGTWPSQKVLCGTLTSIAADVLERGFSNPSVIVVGKVVSLQKELAWFDSKPLLGKRIVVTRARHQASVLRRALEVAGAFVEEYPVIKIVPPTDLSLLSAAIDCLASFDWVVFTGANGVDAFFRELKSSKVDASVDLSHAKVVAVGPATADALAKYGIRNVLVPGEYQSEGVAEILANGLVSSDKVLLVRAQEARAVLPDIVKSVGATLYDVPAYQTVVCEDGKEDFLAALQEKRIDAITFTSSSTVLNTVELLGGKTDLLRGVDLFSIGPITTDTMCELGLKPKGQAASSTIDGLVGVVLGSLGGLS